MKMFRDYVAEAAPGGLSDSTYDACTRDIDCEVYVVAGDSGVHNRLEVWSLWLRVTMGLDGRFYA
jgi:hypothetical protein